MTNKFNKHEFVSRLYFDGSKCIESAEVLFKDENKKSTVPYGVLLIHDIELLLKAYLLIRNTSLSDDANEINKYLKKLGHKYYDIYLECKKYGKDLEFPISENSYPSILEVYLDSLRNTYFEDSIDVRYIDESKKILVDQDIFSVVNLYLNRPIYRILEHRTVFNGVVKFNE